MISKTKLKELAAYRQQKKCDEEGVFIVEGIKMANEALATDADIRCICASSEWLSTHTVPTTVQTFEVSPTELERLSLMQTPNQVWMLIARSVPELSYYPGNNITLVLDRLQDPGNLGTILRTADWFGIRQVVCSNDTVSCYNSKVVQATMGAIFRTQINYTSLPDWLSSYNHPIYGASLHGHPFDRESLQTPCALIIGNESRGISKEVMAHVSHPLLIPNIGGTAESLNAAVATGILLHQLCTNLTH